MRQHIGTEYERYQIVIDTPTTRVVPVSFFVDVQLIRGPIELYFENDSVPIPSTQIKNAAFTFSSNPQYNSTFYFKNM